MEALVFERYITSLGCIVYCVLREQCVLKQCLSLSCSLFKSMFAQPAAGDFDNTPLLLFPFQGEAAEAKFNRFHYSLDDSPCLFASGKDLRRTGPLLRVLLAASYRVCIERCWTWIAANIPWWSSIGFFFIFRRFYRLQISIFRIRGSQENSAGTATLKTT